MAPELEVTSFEFKYKPHPWHYAYKLSLRQSYLVGLREHVYLQVEMVWNKTCKYKAVNLHHFSKPRCFKQLNWSYTRSVNIFMLTIEISIHEGSNDSSEDSFLRLFLLSHALYLIICQGLCTVPNQTAQHLYEASPGSWGILQLENGIRYKRHNYSLLWKV